MRIKKGYIIIVVIGIIIVTSLAFLKPYFIPIHSGIVWNDKEVNEREEMLINFVNSKMTTEDGGIKTNYKEVKSEGDITKGNAVLSESEGMMLLYYINKNSKGDFDKALDYINKKMILDSGVISWRVEDGKAADTSATIDDLRIVKGLLLASERWGDGSYRRIALNISRGIKSKLLEGNLLSDFNDGYTKSEKATLCYIDLQTLKLLSKLDKDYEKVYSKSIEILNNGYISDGIPLYRKEYNWKAKNYDDGDVDMLLSTIVLLNKADVGEDISKSVRWIKDKFQLDRKIYSSYSKVNGEKMNKIESTSIYANLLQIAVAIDDKELYDMSLSKLEAFQVTNSKSEIYGAYGNSKTLEVYSFDNLNALLAWRKAYK